MHKNIIVRLVTYYVAVIFVMTSLFAAFPVLGRYLAAERARQGARAALEIDQPAPSTPFAPALAGPAEWFDAERSVPVVLSLFAALLVTVPVVWVYRWTRPHRRYNQNFAHTLLVVPIAITLVVFLVKGSLALAFSLAGIVAAVRFRTSLEEPLDAVYLFLVIGTGLAAGVQLLFVALIASMLFNAVALAVWRLDVGGRAVIIRAGGSSIPRRSRPFPSRPPAPSARPRAASKRHRRRPTIRGSASTPRVSRTPGASRPRSWRRGQSSGGPRMSYASRMARRRSSSTPAQEVGGPGGLRPGDRGRQPAHHSGRADARQVDR